MILNCDNLIINKHRNVKRQRENYKMYIILNELHKLISSQKLTAKMTLDKRIQVDLVFEASIAHTTYYNIII